jgi:hypothetical protein
MASETARPISANGDDKQSTFELVRGIASDTGTLVRKEVQLAREEITEAVLARVKAALALGVAGAFLLMAMLFCVYAAAAGLANVMPLWAAMLVTAGGLICVAGVAALVGITRMRKPTLAPEATQRTIKEDVEWAREQLKR